MWGSASTAILILIVLLVLVLVVLLVLMLIVLVLVVLVLVVLILIVLLIAILIVLHLNALLFCNFGDYKSSMLQISKIIRFVLADIALGSHPTVPKETKKTKLQS